MCKNNVLLKPIKNFNKLKKKSVQNDTTFNNERKRLSNFFLFNFFLDKKKML